MRPLLTLVILASVLPALAQNPKKNRTSPTGYSDTPQIPGQKWKVHDIDRPRPRMVTPGAKPGDPPSDAVVLFDGKDTSKWETFGGKNPSGPVNWKLGPGWMEVAGNQSIRTKEKFGDVQLHVEWASPA